MLGMEHIALGVCGQIHFKPIGQGIVDHQPDAACFAILAGMTVDMRVLSIHMRTVIDFRAHQSVPEQYSKIVGARIKGSVLQKAVVRRCEGIVEDRAVGDFGEAAQLIERTQNIQIGGCPGISTAACIAGFRHPHLCIRNIFVPQGCVYLCVRRCD